MDIRDLLSKDSVNFSLKSDNKKDILTEMAKTIYKSGNILELDGFIKDIENREEQVSTGIGFGIAIPHTISSFVKSPCIAFGRSENSIDFKSVDGSPCSIFLMIAVSKDKSQEHIKIISHIVRKFAHKEIVKDLFNVQDYEELVKLLS